MDQKEPTDPVKIMGPNAFVWGAATAAYQIEGAWDADGKGPSVWDYFCQQPGRVWEGHSGRVACDHYNRYREDVAIMETIGLQAYRFSISWPRVLPGGNGSVNPAGIDFYDRLVDTLLEAKIQPWATLFHWDFPLALYRRGGWMHPDSPKWFADYSEVMTDRLSDRVEHWMTFNEPQCFVGVGHHAPAIHAPGDQLNLCATVQIGHNVLLAHGRAVRAMRAGAKRPIKIGWAPVGVGVEPESETPADVGAARKAMFSHDITAWSKIWNNSWWGDPVVFGRYPEAALEDLGADAPVIESGDMETISQPIDFYGANIYNAQVCRADADGNPEKVNRAPGYPHTQNTWKVTPGALYWAPKFYYERYNLPIVVTENGLSCHDWVALDGGVHDPARIDFLTRYLKALRRGIKEGIDIQGYFQWSLMDNFEWAEGYKHRFGLVHVDFKTQKRTLKDSALWYRDLISSNGRLLDDAS